MLLKFFQKTFLLIFLSTIAPVSIFGADVSDVAFNKGSARVQAEGSAAGASGIRVKEKKQDTSAEIFSQLISLQHQSKRFAYGFCQNGIPLVGILNYAHLLEPDLLYSSMRVIFNASKSCEYVRDSAVNSVIQSIDCYLVPYLANVEKSIVVGSFESNCKEVLIDFFSKKEDLDWASTAGAVDALTAKLSMVHKASRSNPVKKFKKSICELVYASLEIYLDKMRWDPSEYYKIWDSVTTCANGLYQLSSVLEDLDRFDNLLWSLVQSFCKFLDMAGDLLPYNFYQSVIDSINDGEAFFLELEEQDPIRTKKSVLLECLAENQKKAKRGKDSVVTTLKAGKPLPTKQSLFVDSVQLNDEKIKQPSSSVKVMPVSQ